MSRSICVVIVCRRHNLFIYVNGVIRFCPNKEYRSRGLMEGINMEKSSQGCYKAMQIGFCDSHYHNIMDIQNRLPYSKVVYRAITVLFSCLMEVNVPGKLGFFFFSLSLCSLWWVQIIRYVWLADRVRVFVHYIISLPSLCKLIWRHWNYKMPVRYILSSVWVRLSIFSPLFIIQYMGLCVFSLPISLVMIERIYTLSYYHHQTGSMNYYPLFRVRSWNNGMRCMSLDILMLLKATRIILSD